MRRWIAVVALAVSLIGRSSAGHDQQPERSLVVRKSWVRFDLILGRLTATQIRGGQKTCSQKSGPDDSRHELLSVTGGGPTPSIRYERVDKEQWLTVEILKRNEVFIRRQPQPGSQTTRLEFVQPRQGPVKVVVGDPDQPLVEVSAASLWHLLLAEPELCTAELLPTLELLRPHWNLIAQATRIESELFLAANRSSGQSLTEVRDLVTALGSPEFAQRQLADRQLRAMGVVVLTQFKQLDRSTLSREQRQRIDRIESDLIVLRADTPERIVAWLLNDQSVWLSMLSRGDATKRQVAAARLSAAYPAAHQFDPLAEEAQRRKQIDALRLRISSRD